MLELLSIFFYDAKLLTMQRHFTRVREIPINLFKNNVQLGSFFSISQLKKSSTISKEGPLRRKDRERREKAKINEQAYT